MEQFKLQKGKAVRVIWLDSASARGWKYHDLERITGVNKIVSLGYVVCSQKDALVLTTSIDSCDGVLDPIGIPWIAITELKELGEGLDECPPEPIEIVPPELVVQ